MQLWTRVWIRRHAEVNALLVSFSVGSMHACLQEPVSLSAVKQEVQAGTREPTSPKSCASLDGFLRRLLPVKLR